MIFIFEPGEKLNSNFESGEKNDFKFEPGEEKLVLFSPEKKLGNLSPVRKNLS